MISKAIDFGFLLLENYKKIGLEEKEVTTIFMMDHLINQGNRFITPDLLSLKMTMKASDIDKMLASFLKRGLINYEKVNNKMATTLEPLKKRLYEEFERNMLEEKSIQDSKNAKESLNNIYITFQKMLGRNLSPIEISKIKEWMVFGYTDDNILSALKEAVSKGKKNLRAVDKILLSYTNRDDIEKEGHSMASEQWQKDIEETIKIIKTPWINNNGKN